MMPSDEQVEQAAVAFSRAHTIADFRALIDTWAPRFHDVLGESITPGPRPGLGMEIAKMPGRGGLTARRDGGFFVGIGADGNHERRFTLAHELAHVLFNRSEGQRLLPLGEDEEERLCELFAQRALAPPRLVDEYLARSGTPKEIFEVEGLARSFKISLRASLVVLQERLPDRWPVVFVAATWRGHPKRPDVLGLRIDTSAACGRFFLPAHTRLSSLGLTNLEASARSSGVGSELSGSDSDVTLRSKQAGASTWTAKNVVWRAKVLRAPGSRGEADRRAAICMVDVSQAIATVRRPRVPKQHSRRSPAWEIPGESQMHLVDLP